MCSSSAHRVSALALGAFLMFLTSAATGQVTNVVPALAATNGLSLSKPPALAPWQQRLTLGPGDSFDISLYGQGDSSRPGMVVGPDGRFSYLQALDVVATGMTVDELRAHMETILMKFHLAPRVVILPREFRSKKYYLLGNVVGRGAYPLNQPTTIVEAIARAKGFVTGNQQRSSFTLTDLSHAFLVRRQPDGSYAREPVDFESLFQRGDLQNNKLLAPDDYLYFPPSALEEVYVLGEVRGVGPVAYTKNLSVLGAIAGKGGFTDAAFKQKVLVVRGSLDHPETFVINISESMRAETKDFALQPRDIVYVSRKPWAAAEQLLEAAASDFVRAMATTWTGEQIGVLIK